MIGTAGILAAGFGERLRAGGVGAPKPLVAVGGRTLLARTVAGAVEAGARRVALIVNAEFPELERTVRETRWPVPIDLTVRTTPSSMESFFALAPNLREGPFLLLTVDSIFAPGALCDFADAAEASGPLGTLGLTRHIDDEKPLYANLAPDRRITALGADAERSPWITSGVYVFHPEVFVHAAEARARRLGAFREFLALVLEKGGTLFGHEVGTSIDVDRPEDVAAAERFLKEIE